jgi:DNA-binding transcriptional ArsR family regulator
MINKPTGDFSKLPDPMLDLVAGCFQALSDPTRLKILRALKSGSKSVQDLVAMFTFTQPNISRHLLVLTRAGLVHKSKRGPYVHYSVANPRIFGLCEHVCSHVHDVVKGYSGRSKKT